MDLKGTNWSWPLPAKIRTKWLRNPELAAIVVALVLATVAIMAIVSGILIAHAVLSLHPDH